MKSAIEKNNISFSLIAFLAFAGFLHQIVAFSVGNYENSESQQAHYKQSEFHSFHYYKGAVNENEEKTQEEKDIETQQKVFDANAFSSIFIPLQTSLIGSLNTASRPARELSLYGIQLRIFIHSLCV